jgi:hypothetical protein
MTTKQSSPVTPVPDDFLITDDVSGRHSIIERVVTVDSVPLPEAPLVEIERIRISERVIPLPDGQRRNTGA